MFSATWARQILGLCVHPQLELELKKATEVCQVVGLLLVHRLREHVVRGERAFLGPGTVAFRLKSRGRASSDIGTLWQCGDAMWHH